MRGDIPAYTERRNALARDDLFRARRLGPPAAAADLVVLEERFGFVAPPDLRALYEAFDGCDLGFVRVLSLDLVREHTPWLRGEVAAEDWGDIVPTEVSRADLLALADDGAGNFYAYVLTPSAPHRVVYLCHDPPDWQHRFTSLGAFLEAWLVRSWASRLQSVAEARAGQYPDGRRWTAAAPAIELELDPGMLRTMED